MILFDNSKFFPHAPERYKNHKGHVMIRCTNPGCLVKDVRDSNWTKAREQSCQGRVADGAAPRTPADEADMFAALRRADPTFTPHTPERYWTETGKVMVRYTNRDCQQKPVDASNWCQVRRKSCLGRAVEGVDGNAKQVGARAKPRRSRRAGDPDVPI